MAEAYARGSNWTKLKQRLENDSWQDLDFLRLAYLSRALDRLGDENGAVAAWNNAVVTAEANPQWLEGLAKTVLQWGWSRKGEDVLWKVAAARNCPRWVADFLWSASAKAQDAAKMCDASRLLLRADPKNIPARNNYIALALLTGQEADSPHQMAEDLYKLEPNNPI